MSITRKSAESSSSDEYQTDESQADESLQIKILAIRDFKDSEYSSQYNAWYMAQRALLDMQICQYAATTLSAAESSSSDEYQTDESQADESLQIKILAMRDFKDSEYSSQYNAWYKAQHALLDMQLCKYAATTLPAKEFENFLEHFLQESPVKSAAQHNYLIQLAVEKGCTRVVEKLLKYLRFHPEINNNDLIQIACKNGHKEVVKLLLQHPGTDPIPTRECIDFYAALNDDSLEISRLVLKHPKLKLHYADDYALKVALRAEFKDNIMEIKKLLLDRSKVDPEAKDNNAFKQAAKYNDTNALIRALNDPNIDPAVDDNYALRFAALHDNTLALELLLKRPEVDPSAGNNCALICAIRNNNIDLLKQLLTRVTPAADESLALMSAVIQASKKPRKNYPDPKEALIVLLNDGRINPIAQKYSAFRLANGNNRLEILRLLLNSPHCPRDKATYEACMTGDGFPHKLKRYFVRHKRVSVTQGGLFADTNKNPKSVVTPETQPRNNVATPSVTK